MNALGNSFDEDTVQTRVRRNPRDSELLEAVEWLRAAGVVRDQPPLFGKFFKEFASAHDGSRHTTRPRTS